MSNATCQARQFSDMMRCAPCGLQWDTYDPEPPECPHAQAQAPAKSDADTWAAEEADRLAAISQVDDWQQVFYAMLGVAVRPVERAPDLVPQNKEEQKLKDAISSALQLAEDQDSGAGLDPQK